MDIQNQNNGSQQIKQVSSSDIVTTSNKKIVLVGLFFISLSLGTIIGFYLIFPLLVDKKIINSSVSTQKDLSEEKNNNFVFAPQVLEYLENPVLTNWAVRIVGKVVSRSENFLIVEKEGDQIKVIVDNETMFKTFSSTPSATKVISFKDVEIGDSIQGSARIKNVNGDVEIKGLVLGIEQ